MSAGAGAPQSQPSWLVIAHVRDQHADDDEPSYPVAICPTCYGLVTQNAWAKHEDWHRRAERPKLPTRYRGGPTAPGGSHERVG